MKIKFLLLLLAVLLCLGVLIACQNGAPNPPDISTSPDGDDDDTENKPSSDKDKDND